LDKDDAPWKLRSIAAQPTRARRISIGSMLNAKFSRPPLRPPTRDRLRRDQVKRQGSPDREKARPAPHKPRSPVVRRTGPRPIFRRGATRGIGRPRSIAALIGANACRLTGALVADRVWKRRFDEPIPLPRVASLSRSRMQRTNGNEWLGQPPNGRYIEPWRSMCDPRYRNFSVRG
jgi:hypothetical protein